LAYSIPGGDKELAKATNIKQLQNSYIRMIVWSDVFLCKNADPNNKELGCAKTISSAIA
jgi:hypothetical protein